MNRKGWKGREVRLGRETTEGGVGGTIHGGTGHGEVSREKDGNTGQDCPALACIYLQAWLLATHILSVFL